MVKLAHAGWYVLGLTREEETHRCINEVPVVSGPVVSLEESPTCPEHPSWPRVAPT